MESVVLVGVSLSPSRRASARGRENGNRPYLGVYLAEGGAEALNSEC